MKETNSQIPTQSIQKKKERKKEYPARKQQKAV
jgi:hypothetical protein